MKICITGGAGFVGSNLGLAFQRSSERFRVTALDNLKRRGSELNLERLRGAKIPFVHGDIRNAEDLEALPEFDLLIDCSAEPSVHAGATGSPRGVLNTNLLGTLNCLEVAANRGAAFLFLSTSRVYPIEPINGLPYVENEARFEWMEPSNHEGVSAIGIAEAFTLEGARSYYGASKLASELLITEYVFNRKLRALINRCGILTGPWQFGKVDQGVITLWVARHVFHRPLTYTGFGGQGKQVRDILHVDDLFELLVMQIESIDQWSGQVYNVGGGRACSVSLRELTELCSEVSGNRIELNSLPTTNPLDVRIYLSDSRKAQTDFRWVPKRNPSQIVEEIHDWVVANRRSLESILD